MQDVSVKIVESVDELQAVMMLRAVCFMADGRLKVETADQNDLQCTHILASVGDEPVASARIRWFNDFAVLERTCFAPQFRNRKLIKELGEFAFEHIREKGYRQVLTYGAKSMARFWRMLLGFEPVEGRPILYPDMDDGWYELIKRFDSEDFEGHDNIVNLQSPPAVICRVEGRWKVPHPLEVRPRSLSDAA